MPQLESYSGAVLHKTGLIIRDREERPSSAGFCDLIKHKASNVRALIAGVRSDPDSVDDDSRLSDGGPKLSKGPGTIVISTIGDDQYRSPGVWALLDTFQCQV